MTVRPTIIEQSSAAVTEATRAKMWRKSVMHMTREELAAKTGYSVQSIQLFERGHNYCGAALKPEAVQRYRLACAGLLMQGFDWTTGETHGR